MYSRDSISPGWQTVKTQITQHFFGVTLLTLKALIKTAADDKFCDIFTKLKKIRCDIS